MASASATLAPTCSGNDLVASTNLFVVAVSLVPLLHRAIANRRDNSRGIAFEGQTGLLVGVVQLCSEPLHAHKRQLVLSVNPQLPDQSDVVPSRVVDRSDPIAAAHDVLGWRLRIP